MNERSYIGWTPDQLGMTFNLMWGRIRIFRTTMEMLGNPEYYRFLFNAERKMVAIQSCKMDDAGSHLLPKLKDGESYKINSKDFVRLVFHSQHWNPHHSYRVVGSYYPDAGLVNFLLEDAICISEGKSVSE